MNELPENSNQKSANELDTLDYLHEVKSSTCLLLPTTPSPTALDFKHPLSEEMNEGPFLTLTDDNNMANIQISDGSAGDSSSSGDSNSVVQDPVSAQLINNISMLDYQTLSKNGDLIIGQAEDCKINGNFKISSRKLPSFVNWNWGIIRKVLLWIVLSALVACLAAIIAMVVTMPKDCNPDLPWHQGKVFYEIFPASFKDSNNDGTPDLKGIIMRLDYIQNLGASAVRLNYMFKSNQYPEQYHNITSLQEVDRSLGTLKDFQDLVAAVHYRNMYIILDIKVMSMAVSVPASSNNYSRTFSILSNDTLVGYSDPTSLAIAFWARAQNVDGFYLKDLEYFVDDPYFGNTLVLYKQIIGNGKILIASEAAYKAASGTSLNVLLSRIDLIDVHLDLQQGVGVLKDRIRNVTNENHNFHNLWSKPHYPWVHWNIGNINSERISTKQGNNTLALTALELMLPGTVSIFYGDEIGLGSLAAQDVEEDYHEHRFVNNLVLMNFKNDSAKHSSGVLPWISESSLEPKYNYVNIIKIFIDVKLNTPTIYSRAIYKDGNIQSNTGVRDAAENLVVIERWYPRRNTCVFIGNFENRSITTDLSSMYYGGTVVASTNTSLMGEVIYLDKVTFPPNSAVILKLEK